MIKKIDKCKNCQILQLKDKSNQMNRKYHQRSHKCIINIIKVLKVRIRPINENKDTHNHIKNLPYFSFKYDGFKELFVTWCPFSYILIIITISFLLESLSEELEDEV